MYNNVYPQDHFESIGKMMRSLELQEQIKLRDLLNQEITASQEQKLDPAVECFQRGWDDAMNGKTHPISELWDGIKVAEVRRIIEKT
jgi:hypothetical protein